MQVEAVGRSDVGKKREHNEDAILMVPDQGLYVVCDGMGGHAAGEVASNMAVKTAKRMLAEQAKLVNGWDGSVEGGKPIVRLLRQVVEAANQEIYQLAQRDKSKAGMGTTMTMVLIRGSTAAMAHVGDSRLYLCRAGKVHQLSEDHSFVNEMKRRGMDPSALGNAYSNVITRAVGIQPAVHADTLLAELIPDDTLLLCSDGLTRYIDKDSDLARPLAGQDLGAIADALIDHANGHGGADNVSTVVIRLQHANESTVTRQRVADLNLRIETLQEIALFRDLTLGELYKVLAVVRVEAYNEGKDIVREGEAGDSLYAILEGRCSVIRHDAVLATLRRGSHFGEMTLLSQRPRSATVRTTRPSRLLVMDRTRFTELVSSEPQLGLKLMWAFASALSDRLDDVSMQLLASGNQDETADG